MAAGIRRTFGGWMGKKLMRKRDRDRLHLSPDDAPLVAALCDGGICFDCEEPFPQTHGEPVLCELCWLELTLEERRAWLAVREEVGMTTTGGK